MFIMMLDACSVNYIKVRTYGTWYMDDRKSNEDVSKVSDNSNTNNLIHRATSYIIGC